jgi:hypothetical protein
LPRDFPGSCLQGKPGMPSHPFAWNRRGLINFERMSEMCCRSGQVADPSWVLSKQPYTCIHQYDKVLNDNSMKYLGGCVLFVRNRGRGVRTVHQSDVRVGVITKEEAPGRGHPWILSGSFPFRSRAIKFGRRPLRHSVWSDSIRGLVGEVKASTVFPGLLANTRCLSVASRCCRPETGTGVVVYAHLWPCGQGSLCLHPKPGNPAGSKHISRTVGPSQTRGLSRPRGWCRRRAHRELYIYATVWSLVQRSPTMCLYVCDQETPKREAKGPSWTISACEWIYITLNF